MISLFILKVLGIPKKLWGLLVILFDKLKQLLEFIFIKIPRKVIDFLKSVVEFFKILFIPNYKKKPPVKKKVTTAKKKK